MILANRPSLLSDIENVTLYERCDKAAKSIVLIVTQWRKSFGNCRFLIIAYGIYTAATIFMAKSHQRQPEDPCSGLKIVNVPDDTVVGPSNVKEYINFCFEFLSEVSETCPAIKIPAGAIKQHLESLTTAIGQLPAENDRNHSHSNEENLSQNSVQTSRNPTESAYTQSLPNDISTFDYTSAKIGVDALYQPYTLFWNQSTDPMDAPMSASDLLFTSFLPQVSGELGSPANNRAEYDPLDHGICLHLN
jgi:hypothetical protein